jgi:ABC-2 type transport system permease protein
MRTRSLRKYARILWFSARDQFAYLPAFLVRNLFFVVIVFIFWSLWRVVFAGKAVIAGLTLVQTLWYLTFTETVELCKGRIFVQVQEEVKDGTLAVMLCKPYSYALFHLSRAMGESMVKILPILAEGALLGILIVGPLPGYLLSLPLGIVLIVAGLLLTNLWMLLLGLIAFWTEEVSPFYWIVQKLVFILGGLFIPIDLFPAWLGGIARWLPFAFSAYWPAYAIVSGSGRAFLTGLLGAAAYTVVLGCGVALLFALGRRRVHAQGG